MDRKQRESHPLLPRSAEPSSERSTDVTIDSDDEWEEEEEDEEGDKLLFADKKKRGTSLILNDAVLLVLHFFQIYCVVQSMALRWTWPETYVKSFSFVFLFNFDVWEFVKLTGNGTYKSVQGHYTASDTVMVSYWHIVTAWGIFLVLAATIFVLAYIILTYRKRPMLMVQLARLQRVYIILAQVICLPLGIVLARLFHCTDAGLVEVSNDLVCFQMTHFAYIGPAIAVLIGLYILFPIWMISRTRAEMLNLSTDRHEGYLQLKETEYVQGLDILYIVGNFHIFSSFKKHGAYLRPCLFFLSLLVFIFYAGLFQHTFVGAVMISVISGLTFLAFFLIRPFRVTCFNVMLIIAYLCLTTDCFLGVLVNNFNVYSVRSPWLTPEYVFYELLIINGFWLACIIVFIVYLIIRHIGCCKRCETAPLWPSMTSQGLKKLSPETQKYVRAILRGRTLIEGVLNMSPLFAPAHEISRQIQVINAYCREAEHLRDPIHNTLWDLLDELIEAHGQIAPKSLFAESVKESIRHTAGELTKMLPMFVQRLAQREYDFILMPPIKRKLLFKMYCVGLFLNGRRERLDRQQLTLPGVQKVWTQKKTLEDYEDDGYYEDMYPEVETGPSVGYRNMTAISFGGMDNAGLDDDLMIEEVEEWTKQHPVGPNGIINEAFQQDDVSLILQEDAEEDNLSELMEEVPSRPVTTAASGNSGLPNSGNVVIGSPPQMTSSRPTSAGVSVELQSPKPSTAGQLTPVMNDGRPGLVSPQQGSGSPRPGSASSRPASAASAHSQQLTASPQVVGGNSLPGSRPASATSPNGSGSRGDTVLMLGEEMRNSPLPGQIPSGADESEV